MSVEHTGESEVEHAGELVILEVKVELIAGWHVVVMR